MSPSKKIYGLIGYPVKHSLSPAMHNAAFKAAGIDAEYRLFEVKPQELEDFFLDPNNVYIKDVKNKKEILAGDIDGFNITIPYKIKVKEILEREKLLSYRSYYSRVTGATNVLVKDGRQWRCFNTDSPGFSQAIYESLNRLKLKKEDKNSIVIGCGGAGRAVIAVLERKAKKVYVYEKNKMSVESARELFYAQKNKIEFIKEKQLPEIIKRCQLLVNATPLGMREGDPSPINKNLLHKGLFVYDVVYNRDTQLVIDAKEKCRGAVNGLSMLLYQGVLAWKHWTGKKAPISAMRQALEEVIRS